MNLYEPDPVPAKIKALQAEAGIDGAVEDSINTDLIALAKRRVLNTEKVAVGVLRLAALEASINSRTPALLPDVTKILKDADAFFDWLKPVN